MKKRTKILWAISLLLLSIPILIFYFLRKTDAPILHGKVDFSINYKDNFKLDIYEPTKEVFAKRPVLVYYHGGAWVGGDKISVNNDRFHKTFNALREQGYAIISPTYTLAKFGVSPFPDCIADAFDVISWIEQNSENYNFDLKQIGVLGESAGGHLALMTAYADIEKFTKPHGISLNYVVAIYPPTDLRELYIEQREMLDTIKTSAARLPESFQAYLDINQYLFGFDPAQDTSRADEITQLYSPINYVKKEIPKTLLIHGDKDRVVPISQSLLLKEKMESLDIPIQFHVLEGVDHAFMDARPEQKEQTQKWITEFILGQYAE